MDLPTCHSVYPGDGVTDHDQLIQFLEYQQSQIESLKAEIQKLKRPSSWAPPRGALYDAGAHLKPRSGKD
jgi:hypothetical protein